MDKAKAAVSDFVGRSGKHDTRVDQGQAAPVTQENINPTRHENITTAIDREVHQDHHHTTVQPIKDREVLPEKHSHQMAGVQHKEFDHGNPRDTKARLDHEASQFRDTSTTLDTKHSQAVAPTVTGERTHHHVHETVQPVIEKETIAPSVVHTTVPIHETHHSAPEHHGISVLPTKTMADFKSSGHSLTGSSGRTDHESYDGRPRPYDSEPHAGGETSTSGPHHSNLANKADPRVDSDRDGRGIGAGTGHGNDRGTGIGHGNDRGTDIGHGTDRGSGIGHGTDHGSGHGIGQNTGHGHSTSGNTGPHRSGVGNTLDPRVDGDRSNVGTNTGAGGHLGRHNESGHTGREDGGFDNTTAHASGVGGHGQKKPSLLDRLNPMKDADGDGKKGFMK